MDNSGKKYFKELYDAECEARRTGNAILKKETQDRIYASGHKGSC